MVCVVIAPAADAGKVPNMDLGVLARGESIVALGGSTIEERTRSAFADDDSFLNAVAHGNADKFTFPTLEEATAFAMKKIEKLTALEREIVARLHGADDGTRKILPGGVETISRRKRA